MSSSIRSHGALEALAALAASAALGCGNSQATVGYAEGGSFMVGGNTGDVCVGNYTATLGAGDAGGD
jgi:hypothetical protein